MVATAMLWSVCCVLGAQAETQPVMATAVDGVHGLATQ